MVISENCRNLIVLNYKELQTIIAMITESKVIELFCIADDLATLIFNFTIFLMYVKMYAKTCHKTLIPP